MKTTLLTFAVLALSCFVKTSAAQDTLAIDTNQYFEPVFGAPSDTSVYDLGRVSLQKKYTQAITIKAADLERMPFMDLQEALFTYYNGIYGAKQKFAYVIDGVLNTDVNALSVYDIDEVTFVQNAANALNGVLPTGVLVLIKTKRGGVGKSGILINGQTNSIRRIIPSKPIELNNNNADVTGPSTTNLYHHYYLSAYKNTDIVNAGISASVQHNAFPQYFNSNIYSRFKPYGGNRFKLNGYFDLKLGANNTISISAGYVPQRDTEIIKRQLTVSGQTTESGPERFISQNLWYGNIQLKSVIAQRITNRLSVGYQRRWLSAQYYGINTSSTAFSALDTTSTLTSFIAKDDISYQFAIGDFMFNPAVNVTYRESKDSSYYSRFVPPTPGTTFRGFKAFQKMFMVTPSLTVNLANIAVLQAGAQKITYTNVNFSKINWSQSSSGNRSYYASLNKPILNNSKATPLLPFATMSIDVSKILDVPDSSMALSIYASFAKTTSFADDLNGSLNAYIEGRVSGDMGLLIYDPYQPEKTYNQMQGGVVVSMFKNALSFSYNYSQTKFAAPYYFRGALGYPVYDTVRIADGSITTHRLSINFSLPGKQKLKWMAYLNGALMIYGGPNENYVANDSKLFVPNKNIITGGFVNQLSYLRAFAGVNIVYGLNTAVYGARTNIPNVYDFFGTGNTFTLQNVYLGYQLKLFKKAKYLDVFINGRNLWQKVTNSAESPFRRYVADDNKFFGGGFKLAL